MITLQTLKQKVEEILQSPSSKEKDNPSADERLQALFTMTVKFLEGRSTLSSEWSIVHGLQIAVHWRLEGRVYKTFLDKHLNEFNETARKILLRAPVENTKIVRSLPKSPLENSRHYLERAVQQRKYHKYIASIEHVLTLEDSPPSVWRVLAVRLILSSWLETGGKIDQIPEIFQFASSFYQQPSEWLKTSSEHLAISLWFLRKHVTKDFAKAAMNMMLENQTGEIEEGLPKFYILFMKHIIHRYSLSLNDQDFNRELLPLLQMTLRDREKERAELEQKYFDIVLANNERQTIGEEAKADLHATMSLMAKENLDVAFSALGDIHLDEMGRKQISDLVREAIEKCHYLFLNKIIANADKEMQAKCKLREGVTQESVIKVITHFSNEAQSLWDQNKLDSELINSFIDEPFHLFFQRFLTHKTDRATFLIAMCVLRGHKQFSPLDLAGMFAFQISDSARKNHTYTCLNAAIAQKSQLTFSLPPSFDELNGSHAEKSEKSAALGTKEELRSQLLKIEPSQQEALVCRLVRPLVNSGRKQDLFDLMKEFVRTQEIEHIVFSRLQQLERPPVVQQVEGYMKSGAFLDAFDSFRKLTDTKIKNCAFEWMARKLSIVKTIQGDPNDLKFIFSGLMARHLKTREIVEIIGNEYDEVLNRPALPSTVRAPIVIPSSMLKDYHAALAMPRGIERDFELSRILPECVSQGLDYRTAMPLVENIDDVDVKQLTLNRIISLPKT